MKVAVIIKDPHPRGAQIVAYTIAKNLPEQYHVDTYVEGSNPNIYTLEFPNLITTIPSHDTLDTYDVVHLHYCGRDYGLSQWPNATKKLIVTTHQRNNIYSGPCAVNCVVSPIMKGTYMPNPLWSFGVDTQYALEMINEFGAKRALVTIGTLHYAKGPDRWISICKSMFNKYGMNSDLMVFIGANPYDRDESNMRSQAASLRRNGMKILVEGVLSPEKCMGWIDACSALVHPSRSEAASLAIMEATAREKPVILFDAEANGLVHIGIAHSIHSANEFASLCGAIQRIDLSKNAMIAAKNITMLHNTEKAVGMYAALYDSIGEN